MSRIAEYHKHLFEAQERSVRMENEEMTEEQIQQRCLELKNHVINNEDINNRFRNPNLTKIWNSKRKLRDRFY